MDDQVLTANSIVSRSREISEERWVEIKGVLEDAKETPSIVAESCAPRFVDDEAREPALPASES